MKSAPTLWTARTPLGRQRALSRQHQRAMRRVSDTRRELRAALDQQQQEKGNV